MEGLFEPQEQKRGINPVLIVGVLVGVVLIGAGLWVLSWQPSMDDQIAAILAGSYREGTPEFEQITKDIIISTGDDTLVSPNAFGSISMYIKGKIRNKGNRVLNGLEINVAVVDSFNKPIREKRMLVVPTQREELGPGETIDVSLEISGFEKKDDRANIRWKVTAIRAVN
ncbi:MAG TPA: hypothetical protein VNA22_09900 [Pyrinomonadaceae bacterium]|nr:hypothetical protein [Pyrinomonadaceae bacterium]